MQKNKEKTHVVANCVRPLAKNKGITLVALIVTIIVLIILAGVAISTLTGDKGIITNAKLVAKQYENASGEEANEINEIFNMTNREESPEPGQQVIDATIQNVKFIYTPSEATKENVKVKIETTTGYVIQYKIGESGIYARYTSEIEISNNCTIYARLANSSGVTGNYITGNVQNIDREKPQEFIITATANINSITVSGSTIDVGSTGCAATNIGISGYQFKIDNGSWTSKQESGTYTFSELTLGTTYTVQMKAIDKAGNERNSNTITITTKNLTINLIAISLNDWEGELVGSSGTQGLYFLNFSIRPIVTVESINNIDTTKSIAMWYDSNTILDVNSTEWETNSNRQNITSNITTLNDNVKLYQKANSVTYYLHIKIVDELGNTETYVSEKGYYINGSN